MRTTGLGPAQNVFQVHGVDAEGKVLVRRRLRRAEVLEFLAGTKPRLVGMEACATAHHWAREIAKLGHEVRPMPPAHVKPHVERGKADAADAEAIAEAVARPAMRFVRPAMRFVRPAMRFVAVKTADQRSALMLHKTRDRLVRQRAALINAPRGRAGGLGIVVPQGAQKVPGLVEALRAAGEEVPELARRAPDMLVEQLGSIEIGVRRAEAGILARHRADEASRRPAAIPGIGPITASAIAATAPDARLFGSGRQFAARLGLTPEPGSSGGKERLGRVSREGDAHVRRLLVTGMAAVLRCTRADGARNPWVAGLLGRKPARLVPVALANKTARAAWAVPARGQTHVAPAA